VQSGHQRTVGTTLAQQRRCQCHACGGEFVATRGQLPVQQTTEPSEDVEVGFDAEHSFCNACMRQEAAWQRVRGWVTLHALVSAQRAFPLLPVELVLAEPCWSWDDEGAAEKALQRACQTKQRHAGSNGASASWAALAAMVAGLPADLLARVLEFAHDEAGQVFAPPCYSRPAQVPFDSILQEEKKERRCCQHLLTQGACLHGRVEVCGRGRGLHRTLACWYCTRRFEHPGGVEQLRQHAEGDHGPDISAWVRKMRKTKARRRRDWFAQGRLAEVRRQASACRQQGVSLGQ